MTPNDYQKLALRTEYTPLFVRTDLPKYETPVSILASEGMKSRLIHALMGINTESGELTDMMKKHIMYGREFDPINVIEECGDLLWYIALALDSCNFNLQHCMERNIAKLQKRFPDKFSSEAALVRDLDAERAVLEETKP